VRDTISSSTCLPWHSAIASAPRLCAPSGQGQRVIFLGGVLLESEGEKDNKWRNRSFFSFTIPNRATGDEVKKRSWKFVKRAFLEDEPAVKLSRKMGTACGFIFRAFPVGCRMRLSCAVQAVGSTVEHR